jgi:hypothetical protein
MRLHFLLVMLILPYPISSGRISSTSVGPQAVSIWSQVTVKVAHAYSTLNELPIEDCMRPKLVDCFSIQQNTWISDSTGNFVLWAQNAVELAKVANPTYYGTYTFQVWNASTIGGPLMCEPEASSRTSCRVPFYTDAVPSPQSFVFYSHISKEGPRYLLQMSNNFGTVSWLMPTSIRCPCYFATVRENPPPWGNSPFELVTAGLDSSAIAVFRNDTYGNFGPFLVESSDGLWHEASVNAIHCLAPAECLTMLATAEASVNLEWNVTSHEFHWSKGGRDQGAFITAVSGEAVAPPQLPSPMKEIYLYAEFRSVYAYLTIYDAEHRGLGVDPQSGRRIEEVPNSTILHNSSEDLLVMNPRGRYEFLVTAGGNTAFNLFVSKSSNTVNVPVSRNYSGTLNVGYVKTLNLDAENMTLTSEVSNLSSALLPITGILMALLGFTAAIGAVFFFRRKHTDD